MMNSLTIDCENNSFREFVGCRCLRTSSFSSRAQKAALLLTKSRVAQSHARSLNLESLPRASQLFDGSTTPTSVLCLTHPEILSFSLLYALHPHTKMVASITPLSTTLENAALHPYYPLNLPIPSYIANEWPMHTTLAVFGSMVLLLFVMTMGVLGRVAPAMGRGERGTVCWFVLCAFPPLSRQSSLRIWFYGYYLD